MKTCVLLAVTLVFSAAVGAPADPIPLVNIENVDLPYSPQIPQNLNSFMTSFAQFLQTFNPLRPIAVPTGRNLDITAFQFKPSVQVASNGQIPTNVGQIPQNVGNLIAAVAQFLQTFNIASPVTAPAGRNLNITAFQFKPSVQVVSTGQIPANGQIPQNVGNLMTAVAQFLQTFNLASPVAVPAGRNLNITPFQFTPNVQVASNGQIPANVGQIPQNVGNLMNAVAQFLQTFNIASPVATPTGRNINVTRFQFTPSIQVASNGQIPANVGQIPQNVGNLMAAVAQFLQTFNIGSPVVSPAGRNLNITPFQFTPSIQVASNGQIPANVGQIPQNVGNLMAAVAQFLQTFNIASPVAAPAGR